MDVYQALLVFLYFILGLSIGSFLNVLVYRQSARGLKGRSKCLSCGKILTASMLFPLVSFLIQKGKCKHCLAKISWQYPLVELSAGIMFAYIGWAHHLDPLNFNIESLSLFVLDSLIWSTLLAIFLYDLRHKIIPDRWSFVFATLAFVRLILTFCFADSNQDLYVPLFASLPWWIDLLAGPLLALPFALLWFLSGGKSIGLGDAKLVIGIGWFLGLTQGISAVVFGFWIAFFPSIILLSLPQKGYTMKSELPLAPFLILGTLIVYVAGLDIMGWTF